MLNHRAGLLVVALSLGGMATIPATAQDTAGDRNGVAQQTEDEGFDLGWLGLIGLAGLLGLRRRDDDRGRVTATTPR